jgi:hypothetical protein
MNQDNTLLWVILAFVAVAILSYIDGLRQENQLLKSLAFSLISNGNQEDPPPDESRFVIE